MQVLLILRKMQEIGVQSVDGIMADLGVSSPQLDQAERGFSFMQDGPLDMRMDNSKGLTAAEWLLEVEEEDLANIIYQYGEERYSRRIARAIKQAGKLDTTAQLAEIVKQPIQNGKSINIRRHVRFRQSVLLLTKN